MAMTLRLPDELDSELRAATREAERLPPQVTAAVEFLNRVPAPLT